MKKNFIKITSFILVFSLAFAGFCHVFDFKYLDSVYKMKMFYKQPENSIDVLVLGSSHSYQGINTAVFWKEYGYAAYDLGAAAQPIWNTYYYLEEALKTQTPKVIILDTYTLHYGEEYGDTNFAIKSTYGLKWSETKKNAIKASFDPEKSGKQYFFSVLQYHSRYSDLDKTDFYPYQANKDVYENHKGFYCYFNSVAVEDRDYSEANYDNNLTSKNREYYQKILELANSKNIPVICVAIPFQADNYHIAFFNTAQKCAEHYGARFYNFMTDYKEELGLDYETDFSGTQHLNHLGNTKLTRFLANVIKENYSVPDRRGDDNYVSWDADANVYYSQLENYNVQNISNIKIYGNVIRNNRYKVIVTKNDMGRVDDEYLVLLGLENFRKNAGIDKTEFKTGGAWIFENGKQTYYNSVSDASYTKHLELSRFDDAELKVEKTSGLPKMAIYVNNKKVSVVDKGLNVFVYDTLTQTIVDRIGFDVELAKFSRAT